MEEQLSPEQQQQLLSLGEQVLTAANQGDQTAQQIYALAEGLINQDQQAISQIQQIANNQQQKELIPYIQGTAMVLRQNAQQNVQMAKFGAKLNYIKFLKGQCPEGYEMQKFAKGGAICNRCIKKKEEGGDIQDTVTAFKCGRKMKKKACGGPVVKKDEKGTKVETRISREHDGETGDTYKVTRTLATNGNDSTMTVKRGPFPAETTSNKNLDTPTKRKYWNSEVREWNNSKKRK